MRTSLRSVGTAVIAGALVLTGSVGLHAEPMIGKVFQRPFMGASGERVGGESENLYFDTAVYADETVTTGRGGSTALRFDDGTKLQIGASSTVVLDSFVYDPDGGAAEAVIGLSKGIFRVISGEMPQDSLRLETPSATLAIRGTKFIVAVDEAGDTDVWVIEGAVEATPREGDPATARAGQSLVIAMGVPGVTLVDGRTAPRDPAVESDLSFFGPAGIGDREQNSRSRNEHRGGGSNN